MSNKIKGLPVYSATIDGADGMLKISLVDYPAVETDFQTFDAQTPVQRFEVADEEKRLLFGVVMRANFPIYRRDSDGFEYYLVFKADTIRDMAEKYLADGNCNNVNLQHEDGSDVEGVNMTQYFIKDTAKGIAPEGFESIEDGSLFAEFHCTNDDVWEGVKDGEFKGFSLEGIFNYETIRAAAVAPEQKDLMAEAVAALEEHPNKNKFMTLIERMKAALAKGIAAEETGVAEKFGRAATDKGTLIWSGDDDLAIDNEVWSEDEDGNRVDLEDGDYTTNDSKVVSVADGKVTDIKEAEAEEEDGGEQTEESTEQNLRKQMRERFEKIREAFSYNWDAVAQSCRDLLPRDTVTTWFFIYELMNDCFIYEEYDYEANKSKFYKLPISVDDNGKATGNGEAVEVERVWQEVGAAAAEPNAEQEQMRSENDALRKENEALKAKLAEPAAQTAHEAYKQATRVEGETDTFQQIRYLRKKRSC